jgi:hypothetical protein
LFRKRSTFTNACEEMKAIKAAPSNHAPIKKAPTRRVCICEQTVYPISRDPMRIRLYNKN